VLAPGRADGVAAPTRQVDHPVHATRGTGARIADDLGRTVLLRGVNVNGLGEYYQEHADLPATLPLTEAEFAAIAEHGFDVVRLILSWSRLEPQPGQIDQDYLARIEQVVGWARAHDVYVLLDLHQDAWGPAVGTPDGVECPPPLEPAIGWDGAPAWATSLVGTVATCRLDQRELSVAVQTSFSAFFLDLDGVQSHLASTWAAVAGRFAADPAIAGYDLLNEPNPGMVPGADDYVLLGAFYDRALTAIRSAEASADGGFDHIGFFEPAVLTGPLAVPGPLPGLTEDPNLVYAPHLYNESISILPGTIEEGFANAATAAATYGTTFFSGEWGWFGDPAADQPKLERYAAAEDAHLVGGTWWQWRQACGDPHAVGTRHHRPPCAGVSPYSDGLVVRSPENLAVLTRAYPRAAPGVLTTVEADIRSGALEITGTADRAGTSADLWVPARCAAPAVSQPADVRAVDGGWRIEVPVSAIGAYRISVTCIPSPNVCGRETAPCDAERPQTSRQLPATGADLAPHLAFVLVMLALGARRLSRRA
jgi:endoglycosylceramidase